MHLGIDLGTSNSAVVGNIDGQTRLFKTSDGLDVLPSVIYVDKRGHRFVGKAAQDRLVNAPKNVAHGFKRLMGTSSIQEMGGQEYSPEECSAEIIRALVGQAVTESGMTEIAGTVVTIPAAFNQMQSEATASAARLAGIENVSLLQEPVAAAMASIAQAKQKDGVFLVYDLGGGTFDVALVLSTAGAVSVVAHEGINTLGGRDFDRVVFDSVVRPWLMQAFNLPQAFQADPRYRHLVSVARHAVERAKIQLSSLPTASIFLSEDEIRAEDEDGEEIYLSVDLARDELENLVRDRLDETIELCRKVIRKNGYRNEDIARIVPIGGPSKMPIVRDMLGRELAIEVETGLDPMTAVAQGAAIYAESRTWSDGTSSQKPTRVKKTVAASITYDVDYKARVSDDHVRLRIKPEGAPEPGYAVEVRGKDGSTTGKIPLDGNIAVNLTLFKEGDNDFRIELIRPDGKPVADAAREIRVVKTAASAASIPMTYTLALKVQTGAVGSERNELEPLLEKATPLPATGERTVKSAKTIKGGTDDFIKFELFEMAEDVPEPEVNLYIGDIRLDAGRDLERGERIERGDELVVQWTMKDDGTLSIAIAIPKAGRLVDARNLYLADVAQKNFDGPRGAEMASGLLAQAQRDLDAVESTLGPKADPGGALRRRIEAQHMALSTSVEADTSRAASEEARRVRQEVALIRRAPENQATVLSAEVDAAEIEFDRLRDDAHPLDADRHDRLLATTRRLIRENDFDGARGALREMQAIQMKMVSEKPDFIFAVFGALADDHAMVIDEVLHQRLVAVGMRALEESDIDGLRGTIGKMIANRVPGGGDASEMLELAHLLK